MKLQLSLVAAAFAGVLACADASPAAAARSPEAEAACTPDAMRLCSREIPDDDKVASCLAKNRKQLSPACAQVFKGGGKRSKKRRRRH